MQPEKVIPLDDPLDSRQASDEDFKDFNQAA
jgi:hypothetical protein